MYTSKNDKHWLINSCKQQTIRTNLYGEVNLYSEVKIPYMRDVIFMIPYKRFQFILPKIFMSKTWLTSPNCSFVQLIHNT